MQEDDPLHPLHSPDPMQVCISHNVIFIVHALHTNLYQVYYIRVPSTTPYEVLYEVHHYQRYVQASLPDTILWFK